MWLAALPPLSIAIATLAGVAFAMRLRPSAARWPLLLGLVMLAGGAATAITIRVIETFVLGATVGERLRDVEAARRWLAAFGLVGPLHVLGVAIVVWPALRTYQRRDEVDPPLLAATGAAGLVLGRIVVHLILGSSSRGVGARDAILALGDVSLAMTWAYGLARSALHDGRYGGTPFGRYALTAIFLRGVIEVSTRTAGSYYVVAIAIGAAAATYAVIGLFQLRRFRDAPAETRQEIGQATMRSIARSELRRGRLRPLWILLGAITDIGGVVVGFAGAVWLGHGAKIDFGEIDRGGPAQDAAAGLLALGVIASFPISAAIVAMASGGRQQQRAYALEAGLAAMIALGTLLLALGVVAPIAIAFGVACAPIAFMLAAAGAHIVAGRRA